MKTDDERLQNPIYTIQIKVRESIKNGSKNKWGMSLYNENVLGFIFRPCNDDL